MVRKNYKWNISIEEGKKIVDDKITSILTDRGKIELSELKFSSFLEVWILPLKIIKEKEPTKFYS